MAKSVRQDGTDIILSYFLQDCGFTKIFKATGVANCLKAKIFLAIVLAKYFSVRMNLVVMR